MLLSVPYRSHFMYARLLCLHRPGPAQDKFMRHREKCNVDRNINKNDLEVGWYSKEDMSKVLKWGPSLERT